MGYLFTWTNKQSGWGNIQERLDRGLANDSWLLRFLEGRVCHLALVISDHCPILIDWLKRKNRSGNFKIKNVSI